MMKKLFTTLLSCCLFFSGDVRSQDSLSIALGLMGLSFQKAQLDSMRPSVDFQRAQIMALREASFPNALPDPLVFMPPLNPARIPSAQTDIRFGLEEQVDMPEELSDLAFYPVHRLAALIRSGKITSVALTQLFLDRLRQYGDTLACVITITDSLALAQASKADEELLQGTYRGPLHGIPYGIKDLFAVNGYRTTWGAMPYKDQSIAEDAAVVRKLREAGAVLVAKLTLGALAWGDVWYGGQTKNPWNLTQGSSGSSAGSAAATVAGLVPFAIGTETWGSIVSPATRCGATGLRPTFGRVSRSGAMVLSWSMDKAGPICHDAVDCALVFDAIRGVDGKDPALRAFPFNYDATKDVRRLRIGVLNHEIQSESLNAVNDSILIALLKQEGFDLVSKSLPTDLPVEALSLILEAEAGAAFDELTRSGRDTLMVRQMLWPNTLRVSRLIPAVEYIQANRLRYQLTVAFNTMMQDIDVLIAPSLGSENLITNLTGHPCVVLPDGSYRDHHPGTITLVGNHFDEAAILLFARYLQDITPYEEEIPPGFD